MGSHGHYAEASFIGLHPLNFNFGYLKRSKVLTKIQTSRELFCNTRPLTNDLFVGMIVKLTLAMILIQWLWWQSLGSGRRFSRFSRTTQADR